MKKTLCLCLLLAALVAGVVSQGCAQFGDENQKLNVYGGIYVPAGSDLADMGASVWTSFGLGMNIKMDDMGRPGGLVGLDYSGVKDTFFSASKVSLSYTHFFRQPVKGESVRGVYFGVGLSANALKEKIVDRPFHDPWPIIGENNSGIKMGAHALVGYDLNQSFYVELKYSMVSELAPGADFSGLTLSVGTSSLF